MPPMVRVDVTVHWSQTVCGTSVELANTWQLGVLVAVGVLVRVGVLLGVLVGPTVGQPEALRMANPQASKVPVSWAALSVMVSVQRPLAFWPLNVESRPAPVPPVLKVPLGGTGHTALTDVAAASSMVMLLKSAKPGLLLHTCPMRRTRVPAGELNDTLRSPT
jgi:hypothetical protein